MIRGKDATEVIDRRDCHDDDAAAVTGSHAVTGNPLLLLSFLSFTHVSLFPFPCAKSSLIK
jgi:hypothetical protein